MDKLTKYSSIALDRLKVDRIYINLNRILKTIRRIK